MLCVCYLCGGIARLQVIQTEATWVCEASQCQDWEMIRWSYNLFSVESTLSWTDNLHISTYIYIHLHTATSIHINWYTLPLMHQSTSSLVSVYSLPLQTHWDVITGPRDKAYTRDITNARDRTRPRERNLAPRHLQQRVFSHPDTLCFLYLPLASLGNCKVMKQKRHTQILEKKLENFNNFPNFQNFSHLIASQRQNIITTTTTSCKQSAIRKRIDGGKATHSMSGSNERKSS